MIISKQCEYCCRLWAALFSTLPVDDDEESEIKELQISTEGCKLHS